MDLIESAWLVLLLDVLEPQSRTNQAAVIRQNKRFNELRKKTPSGYKTKTPLRAGFLTVKSVSQAGITVCDSVANFILNTHIVRHMNDMIKRGFV